VRLPTSASRSASKDAVECEVALRMASGTSGRMGGVAGRNQARSGTCDKPADASCSHSFQAHDFPKRFLDRLRRNSKLTNSGHRGRCDSVDLHQVNLIANDGRTWHHLGNPGQCLPSGKWNRNEDPLQPCFMSNGSEKLLIRIDPRAAAFDSRLSIRR